MKGRLDIVNESDTMSPVAGASRGARLGRTTRYITPNVLLTAPSARTKRLRATSSCSLLTKRHILPHYDADINDDDGDDINDDDNVGGDDSL